MLGVIPIIEKLFVDIKIFEIVCAFLLELRREAYNEGISALSSEYEYLGFVFF
jgi:hypothetical protein